MLRPPLPAPFPAVVKLLPEPQPEPKTFQQSAGTFQLLVGLDSNISLLVFLLFSPSFYAWERLALPLSSVAERGGSVPGCLQGAVGCELRQVKAVVS